MTVKAAIKRVFSDGREEFLEDELAQEVYVQLFEENQLVWNTTGSPSQLSELAAGYHYIHNQKTIEKGSIQVVKEDENHYRVVYSNGKERKLTRNVNAERDETYRDYGKAEEDLLHCSDAFRRTGNVHCSALCRGSLICYQGEDLSRHLSVYKTIGACILDGNDPAEYYLCTTGRIPISMAEMIYMAGVKTLVSRSAPTNLTLDFAKKNNMKVLGFVSEKRVNCYEY
ncbi:MAG: hypothetical protein GX567_05865 [Clostridia bacterium]|nr:hypothetical protein [Clostridia bacterium]